MLIFIYRIIIVSKEYMLKKEDNKEPTHKHFQVLDTLVPNLTL